MSDDISTAACPAEAGSLVRRYLGALHDRITDGLEALDTGKFRRDAWQRQEGGGGESRILTEGSVFERAGVAFSHVFGERLPASASHAHPEVAGAAFEAMGLSLVFHPRNPYAPTVHANLRFMMARPPGGAPVWWFGGGFDLTPYYPFDEDVLHWHRAAHAACEPFGAGLYDRYKDWCDRYFFLPHRNETRGVGGLFFDDVSEGGFERCFALVRERRRPFSRRLPADPRARARTSPTASASATSSSTAAAATSSSTSSTTAARCSGCSRAAAPNRS